MKWGIHFYMINNITTFIENEFQYQKANSINADAAITFAQIY